MNCQPTATDLQPEPTDRKAADEAFYRGILHGFAKMASDLATLMLRQAEDDAAAGKAVADLTVPLERAALTARRCITLARTVEPSSKVGPVKAARAPRRGAVRGQIRHAVEAAILSDADVSERAERREALLDRMDAPDWDESFGDKPVEEVIAELCRELGLLAQEFGVPGEAAEAYAQSVRDRRRWEALQATPLAKMSDADLTFLKSRAEWPWVAAPGRDRDDDASGGHP